MAAAASRRPARRGSTTSIPPPGSTVTRTRRARGEGLATSALRLAGGWLLRSCGLERVQILADPENQPMIAAAESAGFVREGVLRGYARGPTGRIDAVVLSLLPAI